MKRHFLHLKSKAEADLIYELLENYQWFQCNSEEQFIMADEICERLDCMDWEAK